MEHLFECRHPGRLSDQNDSGQVRPFRLAVQNLFQAIQPVLGKSLVADNKRTAPGPYVIQHLVQGFANDRLVAFRFQYAADQRRVPPSGQQDRNPHQIGGGVFWIGYLNPRNKADDPAIDGDNQSSDCITNNRRYQPPIKWLHLWCWNFNLQVGAGHARERTYLSSLSPAVVKTNHGEAVFLEMSVIGIGQGNRTGLHDLETEAIHQAEIPLPL